jgi:DNA polymerase-3 subunit gamma/tau
VDGILNGDAPAGLDTLHESTERGNDPAQFARQVIAYFRNVLLMQLGNPDRVDVPGNVMAVIEKHSQEIEVKQLLDLIRIFNAAINDRGAAWQPNLPLEMAFLEALDVIESKPSPPKGEITSSKKKPEVKKKKKEPVQEKPPQESSAEDKTDSAGQEPITILQNWKEVLARVREANKATQALLNSCKPLGIKDNHLVLSFGSDTIKDKMEGGDHIQICQDVIEKVIGVKMQILCVVGGKDQSELPEGIDPDGLVASVVRDLGGTYVSDQDGD